MAGKSSAPERRPAHLLSSFLCCLSARDAEQHLLSPIPSVSMHLSVFQGHVA